MRAEYSERLSAVSEHAAKVHFCAAVQQQFPCFEEGPTQDIAVVQLSPGWRALHVVTHRISIRHAPKFFSYAGLRDYKRSLLSLGLETIKS